MENSNLIECFGCRSPNSNEGSWDGAYICLKNHQGGKYAMFENGKSFFLHDSEFVDWDKVLHMYSVFIQEEKWVPMTNDDINKTLKGH